MRVGRVEVPGRGIRARGAAAQALLVVLAGEAFFLGLLVAHPLKDIRVVPQVLQVVH